MGKMLKGEKWVRPRRPVGTKVNTGEYMKHVGKLPIFNLGENDFVIPVTKR